MSLPLPVGDYFGLKGLWVESLGQLHTDIYALSTATAVFCAPAHSIQFPKMYTPHPLWNFLHMEKRTVSIETGFVRATCEYAGFEGTPIPIIEYSSGVNEEPIQTHKDFLLFGGKPSAPLNGAVFVDHITGEKSTSDELGVFSYFWLNPPNKWSGVTSYLSPVLIKRITQIAAFPVIVEGLVGHIVNGLLCTSASSTRRGNVYQNVTEFRSGGPRGINTDLYT